MCTTAISLSPFLLSLSLSLYSLILPLQEFSIDGETQVIELFSVFFPELAFIDEMTEDLN
jgi:hypothetical protein